MAGEEWHEEAGGVSFRLRPDYWYLEAGIWLAVNEARGTLRIGLADDRQWCGGPVESVELPLAGMSIDAGDDLASLETEETELAVAAPVDGIVVAINRRLLNDPGLVNTDPYGAGWLVELRPARWPLVGVLDAASYVRALKASAGERN